MTNASGTARPQWLELACTTELTQLAETASAIAASNAAETRADIDAISPDTSELARELEVEVLTDAGRAKVDRSFGTAVTISRHKLEATLNDAGVDAGSGDGKATLTNFDKSSTTIQSASLRDYDGTVTGEGGGGGATLSFAEKMRQRAAALSAASGQPEAPSPSASPAPTTARSKTEAKDVRLRDHAPRATSKRRIPSKWLALAAGGLAAVATAAVGITSMSAESDVEKPSASQAADADRPLGAGSPERLREFQRVRKERRERERKAAFEARAASANRGAPVGSTKTSVSRKRAQAIETNSIVAPPTKKDDEQTADVANRTSVSSEAKPTDQQGPTP